MNEKAKEEMNRWENEAREIEWIWLENLRILEEKERKIWMEEERLEREWEIWRREKEMQQMREMQEKDWNRKERELMEKELEMEKNRLREQDRLWMIELE